MQYVASHYLSIEGKLIVRGEFIPGKLPKEQLDWLLSTGAVIEVPDDSDKETDAVNEMPGASDSDTDDQEIEIELPTAAKKSRRQNKGKEG